MSFRPYNVLLIALPVSEAMSTALRPFPINGTFLKLFAVAAKKLAPPLNGANKAPAVSSKIALVIIPAVYANDIAVLLKKEPNPGEES